jgi:hypothetical protein
LEQFQLRMNSYLKTYVTDPFTAGALPMVKGKYKKTIPAAVLYGGVPGGVPEGAHDGGDLELDLFDLQKNFSASLLKRR